MPLDTSTTMRKIEGLPDFEDIALRYAARWEQARLERELEFARLEAAQAYGDLDATTNRAIVIEAEKQMRASIRTMQEVEPQSVAGVRAVLNAAITILEHRRRNAETAPDGDVIQLLVNVSSRLGFLTGETRLGYD